MDDGLILKLAIQGSSATRSPIDESDVDQTNRRFVHTAAYTDLQQLEQMGWIKHAEDRGASTQPHYRSLYNGHHAMSLWRLRDNFDARHHVAVSLLFTVWMQGNLPDDTLRQRPPAPSGGLSDAEAVAAYKWRKDSRIVGANWCFAIDRTETKTE